MSVNATLLRALEQAIQAEIEGYHFYTMAAEATDDPKGAETFGLLAKEEVAHTEFLRAQYKALESSGRVDKLIRIIGEPGFSADTPFFSDALRRRASKAHFEMTVLSVGAQLEADAMRFYQEQSELAEDPEVAALFRELVEWERGHHDALVAQMKSLEQEYWAANRFAPF
jgi:rubrerythrin